MATLFETLQFFDDSGNPLSNGHLYWQIAGGSTPKTVWQDRAETSTYPYPLVLDLTGRPPGGGIFLRGSYKLIIKDSTDSVTYQTIDQINEYDQYDFTGLNATIGDLNSTKTTSLNINAAYTVTLGNRGNTLMCDATSTSFNVSLLPSITALNTYKIIIKKVDVSLNTVAILPFGSETIDTDIDLILYDFNDFVELQNDGSNWKVVASQIRGTIITQTVSRTVSLGTPLTLEDNGKMFNCDSSSTSLSFDLPDCRAVGRGYKLTFKKNDSSITNTITLTPTNPQTIDGSASYVLSNPRQTVEIKTNGLNWYIVSESNQSSSQFQPGMVIPSYTQSLPGWIWMNETTIGSPGSGAFRANADTLNLYTVLWNNTPAPWLILLLAGSPTTKGATATADFNAGKTITLPKMLGRSMVNCGNAEVDPTYNFVPGSYIGNYTHTLSVNELALHAHNYADDPNTGATWGNYGNNTGRLFIPTGGAGSSSAFSITHPVSALYFLIKL